MQSGKVMGASSLRVPRPSRSRRSIGSAPLRPWYFSPAKLTVFFPRNAIEADIDHGHAGPRSLRGAPLVPLRRRDRGRQVRPCCGLRPQAPDARLGAHKRARQVSPQPAFVEAGGDNEDLGAAQRQCAGRNGNRPGPANPAPSTSESRANLTFGAHPIDHPRFPAVIRSSPQTGDRGFESNSRLYRPIKKL
jgi:hypothetical protein